MPAFSRVSHISFLLLHPPSADLDVDRIDEHHRIYRVQRPVLPLAHGLDHPVSENTHMLRC
jgi:hypothetical protein